MVVFWWVIVSLFICLAKGLQCPEGFANGLQSTVIDFCYKYLGGIKSFDDAQSKCNSLGGNLVTVDNAFLNTFLQGFIKDTQGAGNSVWIGAKFSGSSYVWEGTGNPITYQNWDIGEPLLTNGGCAYINPTNGKWKSASCGTLYPYLCQVDTIPITENPVCDDDSWKFFNATKSCYKVIYPDVWINSSTAEILCEKESAQLASVHSYNENFFIFRLAYNASYAGKYSYVWTGLFWSNHTKPSWNWKDATPLDYTAWASGRPGTNPQSCNAGVISLLHDQPYWWDVLGEFSQGGLYPGGLQKTFSTTGLSTTHLECVISMG